MGWGVHVHKRRRIVEAFGYRPIDIPAVSRTAARIGQNHVKAVQPLNQKAIRICFLIDRLGVAGTELQLRLLIEHLDRQRIQPYLVLLDGCDFADRSLEPSNCPVIRLGIQRLSSPLAFRRLWSFVQFLRREKIDVIQTFFPDSTYFGIVAGRASRIPKIVSTRRNIGHWLTPTHRRASRFFNRWTNAVIANCEACKTAVIEQEHVDAEQVHVIPNCIDLARFAHISPYERSCDEQRYKIGMLANLRRVKGADIFVRAAALVAREHPGVVFELAGAGNQDWIRRIICESGMDDRVRLLGRVDGVPDWLATLDVAVLASRAEGLSNALLEYMAAGRPIVATCVGGNPELIVDGKNGLLVEPESVEELAFAIGRLIADAMLSRTFGKAVRDEVRGYSVQRMVVSYEKTIAQLLGRAAAQRQFDSP